MNKCFTLSIDFFSTCSTVFMIFKNDYGKIIFKFLISPCRSVFDVVEFKNKSAALIMSTLQSDINNCQQRTQRSMQTHTAHFAARKKQMEDTKVTKCCAV